MISLALYNIGRKPGGDGILENSIDYWFLIL